jgi:hypothetical protein
MGNDAKDGKDLRDDFREPICLCHPFSLGGVLANAAIEEKLTVRFSVEVAGREWNAIGILRKKSRKWRGF